MALVALFTGASSDGTLLGVDRRKKAAANPLAPLKSIRGRPPDGAPIYLILDNLAAHKSADIRRWAKKNKVNLCFTPTYASWANPIEAHFGPLRQLTVANFGSCPRPDRSSTHPGKPMRPQH